MNIGMHVYAPALSAHEFDVTGLATTVRHMIDSFTLHRHSVLWLSPDTVPGTVPLRLGAGYPDDLDNAIYEQLDQCDVIVVMWRWRMPSEYVDRNAAWVRQCKILDYAQAIGIPTLVHDQDLKVTDDEIAILDEWDRCVLTTPEIAPRPQFRTLHYPYPYGSRVLKGKWHPHQGLTYVGNNYERWDQTVSYLNALVQAGIECRVWGNWLTPSPHRQSIAEVREAMPYVHFLGKLEQPRILSELATANMTIHLAKPEMCERGFLAVRWAEAVAAGIPALLPAEFRLHHHVGEFPGHVISLDHAITTAERLDTDEEYNHTVLEMQRSFVLRTMRIEPWIELLENMESLG